MRLAPPIFTTRVRSAAPGRAYGPALNASAPHRAAGPLLRLV